MKKVFTHKGIKIVVDWKRGRMEQEAEAIAPDTRVFVANGVHWLQRSVYGGADMAEDLATLLPAIKADIDEGLEGCSDLECEDCHPPAPERLS